MQSRKFYELIR